MVHISRLRAALEKLNPTLPPKAIAAAIDELTRDRSAMLLEQATPVHIVIMGDHACVWPLAVVKNEHPHLEI